MQLRVQGHLKIGFDRIHKTGLYTASCYIIIVGSGLEDLAFLCWKDKIIEMQINVFRIRIGFIETDPAV